MLSIPADEIYNLILFPISIEDSVHRTILSYLSCSHWAHSLSLADLLFSCSPLLWVSWLLTVWSVVSLQLRALFQLHQLVFELLSPSLFSCNLYLFICQHPQNLCLPPSPLTAQWVKCLHKPKDLSLNAANPSKARCYIRICNSSVPTMRWKVKIRDRLEACVASNRHWLQVEEKVQPQPQAWPLTSTWMLQILFCMWL